MAECTLLKKVKFSKMGLKMGKNAIIIIWMGYFDPKNAVTLVNEGVK